MRKQQKKKGQRTFAIIVVAAVAITMIGSSFAMIGSSLFNPSSTIGASGGLQAQKATVDRLSQSVAQNPTDDNLQLQLGNAYFDLGIASLQTDTIAAQDSFKKAVEAYQVAIKTKRDINLLVDMATAAFYAGDNDLADKTFKESIKEKPEFLNARFNYGIFLRDAKQDYNGAIDQWEAALATKPSSQDAERLRGLIKTAQDKIQQQLQDMLNNNTTSPSNLNQGGK